MKSGLLYLTLGGLLVAAVAVALYTWDQMAGVSLSTHGIIALVLGVVVSLGLGVGLMALVFYSHRKGYDRLPGDRSSEAGSDREAGEGDDRGDAANPRQDDQSR